MAGDGIAEIFGLAGKTALVTGAATGIGREIARLFHRAGAELIGADINEAGLASLAEELGERVRTIRADMGDPDSIAALFGQVERLDVLVNCAAIYPMRPFEQVDVPLIDRMLDINLRGVFLCIQQAVGIMRSHGGGSIVNISSVNSIRACIFDNAHYGVTKAGLNSLTATLAPEYGPAGIRINAVLPGGVATDQAMKAMEDFPTVHGPIMQPGRVPLANRLCAPGDIANACLFLASDASAYVTGQLLAVDGGFLVS
jgi:NAD(P)-dependent dehydrogenase (short-subunit alcohol dehydrogenase family)